MRSPSVAKRVLATSPTPLFGSCGATRHSSSGPMADLCHRGMGEWAEEYAAEFDAIDPAVDWIKNHREEFLVGAVIVIAGVAFAVAVAASAGGALILVPGVFLVEDAPAPTPATRFAGNLP